MDDFLIDKKMEQTGFTLVETAIVLIIVASLMAIAVLATSSLFVSVNQERTIKQMERVADSLAQYAMVNYRIPCPANPGELHASNNFGREDSSRCGVDGIIPFKELGLPPAAVKDSWGRYMSYAVSRTSARTSVNASTLINNWCMTYPLWFADPQVTACSASNHKDLMKAAFCCGTYDGVFSPDEDLSLHTSHGELSDVSRKAVFFGRHIREYRTISDCASGKENHTGTTEYGNGLVVNGNMTHIPVFPAFVFVSHGDNGGGAYLVNQTTNRSRVISSIEDENYDNDRRYRVADNSNYETGGAGNSHSRRNTDDIVFWQTPQQLLGRLGGTSGCLRP